jgi:hypothetical protein
VPAPSDNALVTFAVRRMLDQRSSYGILQREVKDALRTIRGYGSANRVRFSAHSYQRMDERGLQKKEVIRALASARTAIPTEKPGRWRVTGPDFDDDELTVIVAIENGLLVVTVF